MPVKKIPKAKARKTDEGRAIRMLTERIAQLERQLRELQGGPTIRNAKKQKAEPKRTVGAKVSKHLAVYWRNEARRRQIPMNAVITEGLIAAYGMPDDE